MAIRILGIKFGINLVIFINFINFSLVASLKLYKSKLVFIKAFLIIIIFNSLRIEGHDYLMRYNQLNFLA